MNSDLATIACDESGSEGENLMSAAHPDFVHASVHLTRERALDVLAELRAAARSQAHELKSKAVMSARARPVLVRLIAELASDSNICLVDKGYFASAKLIDLILAEEAHLSGVDLAITGEAAQLARQLQLRTPVAVGEYVWRELLSAFNELVRRHVRSGSEKPDPSTFFTILDVAREASRDPIVTQILTALWGARHLVADYDQEDDGGVFFRELDPMITTVVAVARTWGVRLGGGPFEFVVDKYWGLDELARAAIVDAARIPMHVGDTALPIGDLRAMRVADSRDDPRIQVADILAGVGRENARLARLGVFDDPLQVAAHEALDFNGMWALGSPLDILSEQAPLRYFHAWARVQSESSE